MMAPLLSPAPTNSPARISQLLPSVKCSNCNFPVPLSELGDHVCPKPPPVHTLPKPSVSLAVAASLLPTQLKGRAASPAPLSASIDSRQSSVHEPQHQQRSGTPPVDRLRVKPASSGPYQQKSSPLARSESDHAPPSSNVPRSMGLDSPFRPRPPPAADFRTRTANAGSVSSGHPGPSVTPSPTTARPSFSSARDTPPPANVIPPPRKGSFVTYPPEAEIDTKTGGEAGMAGVGRRGFAAAARVAMFVGPYHAAPVPHSLPPRRPNAPGLLDIQVPTRSVDTPPLSAGSGYSSHSPGVSPYPQSPGLVRSPSPSSKHAPQSPRDKISIDSPAFGSPSSPTSIRMPFLENFRNQLPGVAAPNSNTSPLTNTDTNNNITPSTALPPHAQVRQSVASTSSTYSRSHSSHSISISTTSSRRRAARPMSPSSGSEFGLAYADSTDNEDDRKEDMKTTKTKANPPPPLPLTSSILRSGSIATTNHVRFPSTSEYSERSAIRIPGAKSGHTRNASASSASSFSSASGDDATSAKGNSAMIAHALGLSQTPPSDYARLGGPGSTMGGRIGRSTSGSSSGGRSAYSLRTSSSSVTGGAKSGKLEGEMQGFDAAAPLADEYPRGLSKSKSTSRQKPLVTEDADHTGPKSASAKGPIASISLAQRSNTVQVASTTEKPKLIARARTSTERQIEAVREKKEKIRKIRECVKCSQRIEDGRWIQVDGGGVLCEHCWKNMYLPKCRRCNLPIEKQAVSSKDGQLKGKYHRECFNCFKCSKPFPDKSFYVFDGKPLCAYHYHEANESLCAAARCGQPIEGPCAVSHTGDRYHPEHMTCEYPGHTPCLVTLEEYWEVDGRMLCERHAKASNDDDSGSEEWVQSSKAKRRVTRFIDLAGGGGLSESDSSDLR